ncbi:MAG: endolytic transglycosylase MltG [Pseudomonadota bacterium]|nr:endolytic transglycosylase MltG [Pseudomonadota bacterium]
MSLLHTDSFQKRKWLAPALCLLLLILLIPLLALAYLINDLNQPMEIQGESIMFVVESGTSLTRVANELESMDLIDNSGSMTLYARIQRTAASIQSGEYELTDGMTSMDFLRKMLAGDTYQYRITLIEGWTLEQALNEIWSDSNIVRELNSSSGELVADSLNLVEESVEGLFYPDTYFFTRGTTDREILIRAYERMKEVLTEAWESRLGALPYNDAYDALIMASIIEKESAEESERGHIAGVFVRRLELGMRLQSDPTVIYGMGDNFDGDIRREDLLEETAYNTYRINGLPPTPIALAGIDSINASLNPLPSDYLYFVSRGNGTHYFSSTLQEHNDAVSRFQLESQ